VTVNVIDSGNSGNPQHYQIVQTAQGQDRPTNAGVQSNVSFIAFSSISTTISVRSVLSISTQLPNGSEGPDLASTGFVGSFSDGTSLNTCTTTFSDIQGNGNANPPCVLVPFDGSTVTLKSITRPAVTNVGGFPALIVFWGFPFTATLTTDIELTGDSVILNNTTLDQQNGTWVNGIVNGVQWDHQTFSPQNSAAFPTPGSTDSVTIPMGGNVTPSTAINGNEIAAFATDRPVALMENVSWTPGLDNIKVPFSVDQPLALPIRIWVVYGDYPQQRDQAWQQVITATNIWRNERMGLVPSVDQIVDATVDKRAPNYEFFNCLPSTIGGIMNDIGYVPHAINVYMVNFVDDGNPDPTKRRLRPWRGLRAGLVAAL
jgi:hypothetical protein